jgi:hypothetical protein
MGKPTNRNRIQREKFLRLCPLSLHCTNTELRDTTHLQFGSAHLASHVDQLGYSTSQVYGEISATHGQAANPLPHPPAGEGVCVCVCVCGWWITFPFLLRLLFFGAESLITRHSLTLTGLSSLLGLIAAVHQRIYHDDAGVSPRFRTQPLPTPLRPALLFYCDSPTYCLSLSLSLLLPISASPPLGRLAWLAGSLHHTNSHLSTATAGGRSKHGCWWFLR